MKPIITSPRAAIISVFLLTAALIGCTADGGDDSATTSSTAAETPTSEDRDGTDDPPDEPTTTEGEDDPADPDDLDLFLPTEADLAGWTEIERGPRPPKPDFGESDLEDAITDQCPELATLLREFDETTTDESAHHAVFTRDGIEAEFIVGAAREHFNPENIEALAGALEECEVEYAEDGYEWLIVFFAALDESFGDYGFNRWMASEILLPNGEMTELHVRSHMFAASGLAAEIIVTDGIEQDGSPIPADPDLLDEWLPQMEAAILAAG